MIIRNRQHAGVHSWVGRPAPKQSGCAGPALGKEHDPRQLATYGLLLVSSRYLNCSARKPPCFIRTNQARLSYRSPSGTVICIAGRQMLQLDFDCRLQLEDAEQPCHQACLAAGRQHRTENTGGELGLEVRLPVAEGARSVFAAGARP